MSKEAEVKPIAELVAQAARVCEARGHGGLWPCKENCIVCGLAEALESQAKRIAELEAERERYGREVVEPATAVYGADVEAARNVLKNYRKGRWHINGQIVREALDAAYAAKDAPKPFDWTNPSDDDLEFNSMGMEIGNALGEYGEGTKYEGELPVKIARHLWDRNYRPPEHYEQLFGFDFANQASHDAFVSASMKTGVEMSERIASLESSLQRVRALCAERDKADGAFTARIKTTTLRAALEGTQQ